MKDIKKLIIGGLIILFVLMLPVGFFINKKMNISSLEKKAEELMEIEEYDTAKSTYQKLYELTGNVDYKTKIKQVDIKAEITTNLEEGKEYESEGDYVKAIISFKKIPKEEIKSYKYASEHIDSLKKDVIKKAHALIDAGNNSSASLLLSDYITVIPDDKTAIELLKKVSGKSQKDIEQIILTKEVPVSTTSNASSITGTYQTITSGEANVRSGPSKSSSIVGSIPRGTSVYIYEIYVESAYRTWCRTDYGWISYNTMNGTIR